MYFWERKSGIRDSDEKSAGCGILVKRSRNAGSGSPLPDLSLQLSGATEVALLLNRPNFNKGKTYNYKGSLLLTDEPRFFGEQGWRSGENTRLPQINVARVRFSVPVSYVG